MRYPMCLPMRLSYVFVEAPANSTTASYLHAFTVSHTKTHLFQCYCDQPHYDRPSILFKRLRRLGDLLWSEALRRARRIEAHPFGLGDHNLDFPTPRHRILVRYQRFSRQSFRGHCQGPKPLLKHLASSHKLAETRHRARLKHEAQNIRTCSAVFVSRLRGCTLKLRKNRSTGWLTANEVDRSFTVIWQI